MWYYHLSEQQNPYEAYGTDGKLLEKLALDDSLNQLVKRMYFPNDIQIKPEEFWKNERTNAKAIH